MKLNLFKILNDKKLLVFIALLCSYSFWSTIKHSQVGRLELTVPVHIYNSKQNIKIVFPKTTNITIIGPRTALSAINKAALAVFIDAEILLFGINNIAIHKNNLLLPSNLELEKKNIPTLSIITESINP